MKKKNSRGMSWVHVMVLLAMVFAVVVCWGLGRGRNTWTFDDLLSGGLDFGSAGSKTFSLEGGAQYGVLNSGPNYALSAGTYRFTWTAACDGVNRIRITTSNSARVEPQEMTIEPDHWKNGCTFTLLDDAENLQIQFCFEDGSYLQIYDAALSFECTDRLWLLTLLTAALIAWHVLERCGWLTQERKRVLLILGAAVLVASVPALRENLNAGHDSEFHRMRLRNTVSALSEGQIPVRVGGYMYNGYGSATSVFYPDICLYLPALLMMSGATIQFALSVLIIALNACSAVTAYACGKRIFASRSAGVCASVLYTLASYRLMDIYTRMALGEAAAMAVIPVFVLGLWEVLLGEQRRWPLLVLGATAVFQTHMLSTVLCAALAVGACALCLVKIIREKRLGALLGAIATTVLLNLFDLVPLLDYMLSGMSMGTLNSSVAAAAMPIAGLFAADPALPLEIGAALLGGTVVTVYSLMERRDGMAKTAWGFVLAGLAAALMATDLFPWTQLESHFGAVVNFLQFPWRLRMFADIFLALACGYGISRLSDARAWKHASALAVLAACMLSSQTQIRTYTVEEISSDRYWLSNSGMITAYTEYTLPESDIARTVTEHAVMTTGDVVVSDYEKRGTHVTAYVDAVQGGTVTLPVFGFDGYAAELDGERVDWTLGDNNRLTVEVPADTWGELHVWFEGKTLWRAADILSLLSVVGLCVYIVKRRKPRKSKDEFYSTAN